MVLLKICSLNLQNILTKTFTAVINFGKVLRGGYFAVNFVRILREVFNETKLRLGFPEIVCTEGIGVRRWPLQNLFSLHVGTN